MSLGVHRQRAHEQSAPAPGPSLPDTSARATAPPAPVPGPTLPDTSTSAPVTAEQASPPVPPLPAQAPGRVLRDRPSEPDDEAATAEHIAQEIKSAFTNGRLVSQDELDSTTACFWFRTYVKHILKKFEASGKAASEFVESLDPCSQLVIKFTVKSLLETKALPLLAEFVAPLAEIKSKLPKFLPGLAEALLYMHKLQESDSIVAFDFLELPQQRILFRSSLYQSFVTTRAASAVSKEMAKVKEGGHCDKSLLQDILAGPADENVKVNVKFALSWFTDMTAEDRMKFLFQKAENFALLRGWVGPASTAASCDSVLVSERCK